MPAVKVPSASTVSTMRELAIIAHHLFDVRDEHEIHREYDRGPVKGLRPDELHMGVAAFYGAPPGGHADKAEDGGKDDPIARHRLPCEVRIGDPEKGEHQHQRNTASPGEGYRAG